MTTFFKKAVSGILLIAVILSSTCLGVFAETAVSASVINAANIRVFNEGAELSVTLSGTPGGEVSVLMLEPDVNLPDVSTDYDVFYEGIAHADTVILDEEGKHTYKYVAERAGVYTVRVKGATIDYTETNNEAPVTNPDRIYVEAWSTGGQYTHADLNYKTSISKAQLDAYGVETVAANIAEELIKQPAGRRTLFFENDLSPRILSDERIWWDEGVTEAATILDEFFAALKIANKDVTVDFIYTDTENTFSSYNLTSIYDTDEYRAILSEITGHAKYPEFRQQLVARGYDFSKDVYGFLNMNKQELHSIGDYDKGNNFLIFNAVVQGYAANYLTQAFYAPAKKHFDGVKYSDYGFSDRKSWQGGYEVGGLHPNYLAGNNSKAGTHSAPVLYSKQVRGTVYREIFGALGQSGSTDEKVAIYSNAGADFKEMQEAIVFLRISANSTPDGVITPYIATEGIETESFTDKRYRNEMLIHVALHNPDRLLYFNANRDSAENAAQAEELMEIMDEVNSFVAHHDRRSLNVDQADFSLPFALSGMYANGKNIWRITPDNEIVEDDFLTTGAGEDPVFVAGDATITFPEGTIPTLATTVSDLGYWVETPEGVTPVITYASKYKTESEAAVITFYNDLGQKVDPATQATVDAVATYKGFYGDKMNFIAAKYDENGTLIDIETKECGIYNASGNVSFLGIGKDLDTDSIKFFLWEDTTIRPLATETID